MKEVDALAEWADKLLEGGDGGEASEEPPESKEGETAEDGNEAPEDDLSEAAGAETLSHNDETEEGNLKAFDLEEGFADAIKKGVKALDRIVTGGDKEDLLKDLKQKAGVRNPENGKPSMAYSDVEKRVDEEDVEESALQASFGIKKYGKKGMDKLRAAGQKHASEKTMQNIRAEFSKKEEPVAEEVDTGQYDAVKSSPKGDNDQNWDKPFREKIKQYAKELEKRQKEKEQGVAESEFAGDYTTGEAGQWRNKGPKAHKPATIGDLVGEGQEDLDTIRRLLGK
jgi:hypothetical protein